MNAYIQLNRPYAKEGTMQELIDREFGEQNKTPLNNRGVCALRKISNAI